MSSHQASSKARSFECCHFCYPFDTHNYCPTCRESGKGDDPCITNQSPCNICYSFSEEQQIKIKHRRQYIRKQKASDPNTNKDDLDLMGDDGDAFSGSEADVEGAAKNLFSSPPCPQPLRFESLSLKTPQTVPLTPGTALQNKIESRLEKSLGNTFNIQLKQEMGVSQASMLEAMKSLRDEIISIKKPRVGCSSGPSNQPDPIPTRTSISRASDDSDVQPMDTDFYGPPLPPKSSQNVQYKHPSKQSDLESDHSDHHSESEHPKAKKHSEVRAKYYSQSSSS